MVELLAKKLNHKRNDSKDEDNYVDSMFIYEPAVV